MSQRHTVSPHDPTRPLGRLGVALYLLAAVACDLAEWPLVALHYAAGLFRRGEDSCLERATRVKVWTLAAVPALASVTSLTSLG